MDRTWFLYLNGLPAGTPTIATFATVAATYGITLYPVLLLGLWMRGANDPDRRRRVLLLAVCAAAFALGVNALLNVAFPRPRPFLVLPAHVLGARPHDSSFPSDHAAVATAIAVELVIGGEAGWGVLGLLGALVIGTSRVIIGVHYPSDILGGALVGAMCAMIAFRAEPWLRPVLDVVLAIARRAHLA